MSSTPKTTTQKVDQTSTSGPGPILEPYYAKLRDTAQSAFDLTNGSQQFAAPNQMQLDANGMLAGLSGDFSAGATPLRQLGMDQASGKFLDPSTNPWIKSAVEQALKPVNEKYSNTLLPQVSDASIAQGAYGGSRQDIQENDLMAQFVREAGGLSGSIYADNYARERQLQQNSGNLLDAANRLDMAGVGALAGAGLQQNQWDQIALDEPRAAAWAGIPEMLQVLGQGGYGQQNLKGKTVTKEEGGTNPLASAAQGLMGGAMQGFGLAKGLGITGAAGATGMAALGSFAPWMLPFAALGGLGGAMG